MPWTGYTPPVIKATVCRGSYVLGSACGHCSRCETELLLLLNQLIDPTPCSYDHHDLCQSHGLHKRPCPHHVAKDVILGVRARNAARNAARK
jgi:hypothetical protein